jgi:shikimate dehydrogenase
LIEEGFHGVNVTVPFKGEAFDISDKRTDDVFETNSVNTLSFNGDTIEGASTDGFGLLYALKTRCGSLNGKTVLIAGAGGTTRAILPDLLAAGVSHITIANRTLENARALVKGNTSVIAKE